MCSQSAKTPATSKRSRNGCDDDVDNKQVDFVLHVLLKTRW